MLFAEPYVNSILHLLVTCTDIERWRIHGNGFLQVPITADTRMHVWDPEYWNVLPDNNAQIHNHAWDYSSTVLLGSLVEEVWDVQALGYSHSHFCNKRVFSVGEPDTPGMGEYRSNVRLQITNAELHHAGTTYTRRAWLAHRTLPESRAVTLMTKQYQDDYDPTIRPSVFVDFPERDYSGPEAVDKPFEITDAFGIKQPSFEDMVKRLRQTLMRYRDHELSAALEQLQQAIR